MGYRKLSGAGLRRPITIMATTGLTLGFLLGTAGLAAAQPAGGSGTLDQPECYNMGGYVDYVPYTHTYFCQSGTQGGTVMGGS
jgi:hypothetical protein